VLNKVVIVDDEVDPFVSEFSFPAKLPIIFAGKVEPFIEAEIGLLEEEIGLFEEEVVLFEEEVVLFEEEVVLFEEEVVFFEEEVVLFEEEVVFFELPETPVPSELKGRFFQFKKDPIEPNMSRLKTILKNCTKIIINNNIHTQFSRSDTKNGFVSYVMGILNK
jgi:hypothetical protein